MRPSPILCALVLLIASAMPAHAQWKWKDAAGQVHVSDIPPPREVQDKDIMQRPSPSQRRAAAASAAAAPSPSAVVAKPSVDPELEARKAKARAEAEAKAKADEDKNAALRSENCQRARKHMASLESGQRIARVNSQGEREVLDDKGRADEMAAARRVIESDCR